MTIQEMQARKRELGYTNQQVAELSGLPLGTVQKVFSGATTAPRRETVLALERVLKTPDMLREDSSSYDIRRQKLYTLDDYYALPDEVRVELIDGVFYDMAGPSKLHQQMLGKLHLALAPCVERHPECDIYMAPSDVVLDNDEYTILQPDIFIVCNCTDTDPRRLNGAPDFTIEILSPSNRAHDLYRKLMKYSGAGVREYWIVDPEREKVLVYDLAHEEGPETYSFEDTVPVLISNGECEVDFSEIRRKLAKFYA